MKKFVAALASFVFLLIVAALAAPFFISADTYKSQIIAKVESATGRKISIDGPLSFKLFPIAGITAEKVTLSNPAGFDDPKPFLTLSSMNIEVAVMPLLHKEIEVKQFVLHDPVVYLRESKDGRKNWVFTPEGQHAPSPVAKPQGNRPQIEPAHSSHAVLPAGFMLNSFKLQNGTFIYSTGCCNNTSTTEIRKVNADVVIQSAASAASIEGSGDWKGKTIRIKAGIGTLRSMLQDQKMDLNATISTDQFTLATEGTYDHGAYSGKQSAAATSLKDVAAWINPGSPLATPAKLALKADSDVRCGSTYCNLPNFKFTLDDVKAAGTFKVTFADAKPAFDLDLATGMLDVNPFLSAPAKGASIGIVSDAVAAGGHWSNAPIDLSALKSFNLNANIRAEGFAFHQFTTGKMAIAAKIQQGVLTLNIPGMALYKGTGTLNATVNAASSALSLNTSLKTIDVNALLKDLDGMDKLSGTADIDASLAGNLQSQQQLMSSLSGKGQFNLNNGEIRHFNLLAMMHNLQTAFASANNAQGGQSTPIRQLSGSFTIAQGIVANHDLTMVTPESTVAGDGTINLPAYTLSYRLTPKLSQTSKDATTGATTTKEGFAVPVVVEGSLDHPQFRPDVASVLKQTLEDPKSYKEKLRNSREILKGNGGKIKPKDAIKNLQNLLR